MQPQLHTTSTPPRLQTRPTPLSAKCALATVIIRALFPAGTTVGRRNNLIILQTQAVRYTLPLRIPKAQIDSQRLIAPTARQRQLCRAIGPGAGL